MSRPMTTMPGCGSIGRSSPGRASRGFRAVLLEAYHRRCAITGCDATAVLEAAHLRPYRGPDSNTVPSGLLLRSDGAWRRGFLQ
jgi:hypothetical protein